MFRRGLAIFGALLCASVHAFVLPEIDLVSRLDKWSPSKSIEANSEQRNPLFFGKTPYSSFQKVELIKRYKRVAENVLKDFLNTSGVSKAVFEIYPAKTDWVSPFLFVSRYSIDGGKTWKFAWLKKFQEKEGIGFPKLYDIVESKKVLFAPFWEQDLYDKPLGADCLFVKGDKPVLWWNTDIKRQEKIAKEKGLTCAYLPMPPYLNFQPKVFYLAFENNKFHWPSEFHFIARNEFNLKVDYRVEGRPNVLKASQNFKKKYIEWISLFTGETQAVGYPKFHRKNNAQKDHQLGEMAHYFSKYYRKKNLHVKEQKFVWNDVEQRNVIAIQEGKKEEVVIVLDHYDAAFSEDIFYQSGKKETTPGADDNVSATAGVMLLSEILNEKKLEYPIWYVHMTGEEFPADCLGARRFVEKLLREKVKVKAVIVLDMIAYKEKSWPSFIQLSSGASLASQKLTKTLEKYAGKHGLTPLIRPRHSERSFLHQTDALIFSNYGFPVVLVNEWLNEWDNWERPHYHQSTDTLETLNIDYALKILNTVAEGICHIACEEEKL